MPTRPVRAVAALTVAAASLVTATVLATPSTAAVSGPPWEPDAASVGTITFYNTSGAAITSGSTNAGALAAYAVGSGVPRAGDTQAQLVFANPDKAKDTTTWFRQEVNRYTPNPLASGPSAVTTAGQGHPVFAGSANDVTADTFERNSVISTDAGYSNVIQVRLRTANAAGSPTRTYDVADIAVDTATHTWTQIFPSTATAPGAPTNVTATPKNQSLLASWTAPTDIGGAALTGYAVQYRLSTSETWVDVAHTGTTTTQTITGLTNGSSYVVRVAAINSAGTGPYSAPSTAATPVADTTRLDLAATAAISYGASATVSGLLYDVTTSKALAGQKVVLQRRYGGTGAFGTYTTLTTDANGKYSTTFKAPLNVQFQAQFVATATLKASTSPIRSTTVNQVFPTLAASPATIRHGASTKIYGTVSPTSSGTVYLQQYYSGAWHATAYKATLAKQKLPNGVTTIGFVMTVPLGKVQTYQFRTYIPATSSFGAGYRSVNVKVT